MCVCEGVPVCAWVCVIDRPAAHVITGYTFNLELPLSWSNLLANFR